MRLLITILLLGFCLNSTLAQITLKGKPHKKGQLYLYWGWNKDKYTKSDIHFIGKDYDFTLYKVKAIERPDKIAYDPFLKPNSITIPQYNFRMGYFVKDNLEISIGADHMKYVMIQNQTVAIDGTISNTGTEFDKTYSGTDKIYVSQNFLQFEHTDGLNYLNVEINKFAAIRKLPYKSSINYFYGVGAGLLYPRSDVTLMNNQSHNKFHIAGYGVSSKSGLNLTIHKYFFIQTEIKLGYINMPDIKTTFNSSDKAKQHFGFLQGIIVFGAYCPLIKKKKHW
jgi:hypothetical protein